MGRRALRQIDPQLDLSSWMLDEANLPNTLSSASLFQRTADLEIEVGSGKGLFLARATVACPQRDYLGIEVSRKYARFAAARLAKRDCPNGKLVHGDGMRIFAERVSDESIAAVHVYFPDPWWKKRHRKRRLMNGSFVRDVERSLQPAGQLHFWTDVQEYFEATLQLLAESTALGNPSRPAPLPAQHDLDYQTHFERRTRLHDQPVYRAVFTKP